MAVKPPYHLTAILAVQPSHVETLRVRLRELSAFAQSPFARLPATHYVRLAPFDRLGADQKGEHVEKLGGTYLLAGFVFDGDPDRYLVTLARVCRAEVQEIFGCCEGWPGGRDLTAFAAWVRGHECSAFHRFGALPVTAPQVLAALALRQQLIGFAVETQDLGARDLHQAFLGEFGPP